MAMKDIKIYQNNEKQKLVEYRKKCYKMKKYALK